MLATVSAWALMMPLAATGKGTAGLIRGALGDLEMARSEYDRDKGTALFSVELKGRDNRTYTDVSGTYPIIGPWDTVRLIYDRPALLDQWQGKTLREVDLTAQIRHQPGAEVPELPTLNASSAIIPPLLQRWIIP
ncbi:MAG: hypothetical protein VBE63_21180 [Lamprobacter sp.]|uniref:hypothetical protein n=1 Tax=Lamprobacter sp. TaxID=3100796 RepID=UPI002B257FE2|nr:hypothetical protein [Lamprobacter sp.]MEA3642434.1 hypothetical protein [Lamprobacter sp.]